MTWLALLKALLSLVGGLVNYLGNRQLLDAGASTAIADQLRGILDNVEKASHAARAVDPDSGVYSDDYAARVRDQFERK